MNIHISAVKPTGSHTSREKQRLTVSSPCGSGFPTKLVVTTNFWLAVFWSWEFHVRAGSLHPGTARKDKSWVPAAFPTDLPTASGRKASTHEACGQYGLNELYHQNFLPPRIATNITADRCQKVVFKSCLHGPAPRSGVERN